MALAVLACVALGALSGQAQSLDLQVGEDGGFKIFYDGHLWLAGSEVRVGPFSSSDGSLFLQGISESTGSDALGSYTAKTLKFAAAGAAQGKVMMHASYRTYSADNDMIVFEQTFPNEVNLAALKPSKLSAGTVFPGFARRLGPADGLACFAYHGVFPQMQSCLVSSYKESKQGGAPLVIYNKTSSGKMPMLVFSPLNFPKAQHMVTTDSFFGAGIKSEVKTIPAGWRQLFILTAGVGINDGMMAWGDRMLRFTGKARADAYADIITSTIGFWTDNGGYYHYDTGSNKTYEEVLPEVKAYHDSIEVPFQHWQFDSWFYPKDGAVDRGGGGGGVTNWIAMPSVFPHGMASIQSKLGLPVVMHNRQWSPKSDYIKQGQFEWYKSEKAAIPVDPPAFFKWFFQQQQGWGLKMYEQDWMCKQYDLTEVLHTNISMGDLWLSGMAEGAASSGRTVQYCMPYAYDILSAAAYPAVTNARATDDYFSGPPQWAIGGTSLFYWAIGILPFKDGFYSSTHKQVGGQTVGPETSPDREALMATLSCAMVGPMDGIKLLNASRVMSSCRKDGTLLKPDKPLSTSDECFRARSPESCYTYHTYSDVSGLGRIHYFFMNDVGPLTAAMVDGTTAETYAVYNWYTRELSKLTPATSLKAGYEGHAYAVVSPITRGWIFLGELDKYVTASRLRFPSVSVASNGDLTVTVHGVAREAVSVCAAQVASSVALRCNEVTFLERGGKTVSFGAEIPQSEYV